MTENERVREIRKIEGLTLEEFGNRIGLQKSMISRIERGDNRVTDRTRRSICKEFNIRETWLQDGIGDMREAHARDEVLASALENILTAGSNDFRKRLIAVLVNLPAEKWNVLEEIAREVTGDSQLEAQISVQEEIEAEVESYRQQLIKEKMGLPNPSPGTGESAKLA